MTKCHSLIREPDYQIRKGRPKQKIAELEKKLREAEKKVMIWEVPFTPIILCQTAGLHFLGIANFLPMVSDYDMYSRKNLERGLRFDLARGDGELNFFATFNEAF